MSATRRSGPGFPPASEATTERDKNFGIRQNILASNRSSKGGTRVRRLHGRFSFVRSRRSLSSCKEGEGLGLCAKFVGSEARVPFLFARCDGELFPLIEEASKQMSTSQIQDICKERTCACRAPSQKLMVAGTMPICGARPKRGEVEHARRLVLGRRNSDEVWIHGIKGQCWQIFLEAALYEAT